MVLLCGFLAVEAYQAILLYYTKEGAPMAKCEKCGKKTTFGLSRPWSKKSTRRKFKPNLQKVSVYESGRKIRKTLCTRCIRTMAKTS